MGVALPVKTWFHLGSAGLETDLRLGQLVGAPSIPAFTVQTNDAASSGLLIFDSARWSTNIKFTRDGPSGARTAALLLNSDDGFGAITSYFDVYDTTNTSKVRLNAAGDSYFNGGKVLHDGNIEFAVTGYLTNRTVSSDAQVFTFNAKSVARYGLTFDYSATDTKTYLSGYGAIRMFTGLNTSLTDREVFTILGGGVAGTEGNIGINTPDPSTAMLVITSRGATQPVQEWRLTAGTPVFSITNAGLPRWIAAGNQQTTVGAAGAASALPATPSKYLKVVDSAGTTYVIPAYLP